MLTDRHCARYKFILYTGWAKKVGLFILAITFSSLLPANVHNFWHMCTKLIGNLVVSPANTVYVTALPCKILIMTLPICLYMFTAINNNNKYKKSYTLEVYIRFMLRSDIKQITAHYWNVVHVHSYKGFVAAHCYQPAMNCLKPKFTLVTVRHLLP